MASGIKSKREVVKVAGRYNELITVMDEKGNIIKRVIRPMMLRFHPKDLMQVIVGASILAIPVGFTEETWNLGQSLGIFNILGLLVLSLTFTSAFAYYNYYRNDFRSNLMNFLKRVFTTYFVSFLIVALLLTLIDRAPWGTSPALAISRTIIVTFPASMSAAVADMIK